MVGIPGVGIRAAPETSRKIGNGRPKPAAKGGEHGRGNR
jgi:hypothetical protein